MPIRKLRSDSGRSIRVSTLASVAVFALVSSNLVAVAQDDSDGDEEVRKLDRITVTARKQEESLQDVPVAVSTVGGGELDGYQLDKVQEFATRIPTLSITAGGSGGGGSIGLRGIASSDISAAFDSAVALNFDGVVANSARLVQNSFMDVEQVEVLKGPQSLYFGKSASAGVVSFKTRDPGDTFEWGTSAAYEFEERGTIVDGFVSGPLSETFGARLALRYYDAEEIMENSFPGAVNPEIGESSFDGRLTLAWDPAPQFSANLKVSRSEYENDASLLFEDIECGTPGSPAAGIYSPLIPLLVPALTSAAINPSLYDCNSTDQVYSLAVQNDAERAQHLRSNNGVPYAELETNLVRLKLDWDLTENLQLTSVTGYFDMHSEETASYSRTSEGGGFGAPLNDRETLSQEFRLASSFDGPFNFQLGAYYEDRTIFFDMAQNAFGGTYALSVLYPLTGGALGPFGPFGPGGADPLTGNTYDFRTIADADSEATSLFASFDYELTDRWTLAGGLRWTSEEKSQATTIPYTHAFLSSTPLAVTSGTSVATLEFEDENVSPEVSLTYAVSENVNLYGAYKTGFKSGGIDNSLIPTVSAITALNACAPAFNPDTCETIFDSETSEGFEIGLKSELFNNALRLNLVGYEYVFEDLQNQQFISTETRYRTFNVGEITTRGLEADFLWVPDVDGLTINGAIAFLDSEFTEDFISSTGTNMNGQAPSRSPEWSGNLGIDYVKPLADSGYQLSLGGNLAFSDSYFTENSRAVRHEQDGYTTLDLRAALAPQDGPWTVSVIANNVFDEIYTIRSGFRPFGISGTPLDSTVNQNRGRQVFVKASLRY